MNMVQNIHMNMIWSTCLSKTRFSRMTISQNYKMKKNSSLLSTVFLNLVQIKIRENDLPIW